MGFTFLVVWGLQDFCVLLVKSLLFYRYKSLTKNKGVCSQENTKRSRDCATKNAVQQKVVFCVCVKEKTKSKSSSSLGGNCLGSFCFS